MMIEAGAKADSSEPRFYILNFERDNKLNYPRDNRVVRC